MMKRLRGVVKSYVQKYQPILEACTTKKELRAAKDNLYKETHTELNNRRKDAVWNYLMDRDLDRYLRLTIGRR